MTAEDQSIVLMESSSVQKHQVCPVMSTLRERARRIAFSCSTEEGSEDEEGDEEGELLAPPLLTTAVGTCGDG